MLTRNRHWDSVVTFVAVAFIVLMMAFVVAPKARANQPSSPPGQAECAHGNSQATCRPDPQPSHGAECDEHGPHEGGVNEDHCLPTPEVTPSASPTGTASPSDEPSPTPPVPDASAVPSDGPSTTPSPAPTTTPSTPPSPSLAPPTVTPSSPAPSALAPTPTAPPTDTEESGTPSQPSHSLWLILIVAGLAGAISAGLLNKPRRR